MPLGSQATKDQQAKVDTVGLKQRIDNNRKAEGSINMKILDTLDSGDKQAERKLESTRAKLDKEYLAQNDTLRAARKGKKL